MLTSGLPSWALWGSLWAMLRLVHALVFALAAVLGTASGVCALGSETALRGNFGSAPDLVGAFGSQALGRRQQNPAVATTMASESPHAARGAVAAERVGIEGAQLAASSARQGALLRAQLAAEEVAGARMPSVLKGYTDHGLNQAIMRDGVGVSPRAILDAWQNPLSIAGQSGGRFMVTGADGVMVVNAEGRVITTWATNSAGLRVVP